LPLTSGDRDTKLECDGAIKALPAGVAPHAGRLACFAREGTSR
jgi:hypothetical protein